MRDPSRAGGQLGNVTLNVVEAIELDPPEGEEAIRWDLFTSLPIDTSNLTIILQLKHKAVGGTC